MKVVAINCSPRKKGSTATLVHVIEQKLIDKGHDVQYVQLFDLNFKGCKACFKCEKPGSPICSMKDDLYPVLESMDQADAIILGSPVFIGLITGCAKSLIDRCYTFFTTERRKRFEKKIFADVITQGGDIKYFQYVRTHLQVWFIENFGMKSGGSLIAAGLSSAKDLKDQPEVFDKANEIAENIHKIYLEKQTTK